MEDIFIGLASNGERQTLRLGRANRHGLIAGATGTGKTVTLRVLAEQIARLSVPELVERERTQGPEATLSAGPQVGTAIVSTGVIELYGAELGVGK